MFYDISMFEINHCSHGNCPLALYILSLDAKHDGNRATTNIHNIGFLLKIGIWVIYFTSTFTKTISG
jgi:hypothetical protein